MKKAFLILSLMGILIWACNDNGEDGPEPPPGDSTEGGNRHDTTYVVDTLKN